MKEPRLLYKEGVPGLSGLSGCIPSRHLRSRSFPSLSFWVLMDISSRWYDRVLSWPLVLSSTFSSSLLLGSGGGSCKFLPFHWSPWQVATSPEVVVRVFCLLACEAKRLWRIYQKQNKHQVLSMSPAGIVTLFSRSRSKNRDQTTPIVTQVECLMSKCLGSKCLNYFGGTICVNLLVRHIYSKKI
jgi:hypothetical protein